MTFYVKPNAENCIRNKRIIKHLKQKQKWKTQSTLPANVPSANMN